MLVNVKEIADLTSADLSSMLIQVGHTPIQPVKIKIDGVERKIHLKMENFNPTGSMKDRTGYALIKNLEDQGKLTKESVIVESTSGNLGVALAFQCKARGYRFVVVIDPKTTQENIAKMEAFGAHIDFVHEPDVNGGYLLSRLARVRQLCSLHENYVWTDQYSSPANPLIHYSSTGPEIYQQMNERVDAVFVPVSTGGTLAGIGRFFGEVSPRTQVIGVDAYGSVVFNTPSAPRKLTGIGSSRPSSFLHENLYNTYMLVNDEEAFEFCHLLYQTTGIKLGGSSGAVLAACMRYLREPEHVSIKEVVCVCADNGENYNASIFSHEWLQQQGLVLTGKYSSYISEILL